MSVLLLSAVSTDRLQQTALLRTVFEGLVSGFSVAIRLSASSSGASARFGNGLFGLVHTCMTMLLNRCLATRRVRQLGGREKLRVVTRVFVTPGTPHKHYPKRSLFTRQTYTGLHNQNTGRCLHITGNKMSGCKLARQVSAMSQLLAHSRSKDHITFFLPP